MLGHTVSNDYQDKGKSWNKSTKNIDFKTLKNSSLNVEAGEEKECQKRWMNDSNNSSNLNKSTLSLHIAAYENSIDDDANGIEDLSKKATEVKPVNLSLKAQFTDLFEFPRQMEGNQKAEAEIQQFKTSQKLFAPNQCESSFSRLVSSSESTMAKKKAKSVPKPIPDGDIPEWEKLQSQINIVVGSTPNNSLPLTHLIRDVLETFAYNLNRAAQEYDYPSVEAMLRDMVGCVQLKNTHEGVVVSAAVVEASAHITAMIQKTKSSKKRRGRGGGTFRGGFSYRGGMRIGGLSHQSSGRLIQNFSSRHTNQPASSRRINQPSASGRGRTNSAAIILANQLSPFSFATQLPDITSQPYTSGRAPPRFTRTSQSSTSGYPSIPSHPAPPQPLKSALKGYGPSASSQPPVSVPPDSMSSEAARSIPSKPILPPIITPKPFKPVSLMSQCVFPPSFNRTPLFASSEVLESAHPVPKPLASSCSTLTRAFESVSLEAPEAARPTSKESTGPGFGPPSSSQRLESVSRETLSRPASSQPPDSLEPPMPSARRLDFSPQESTIRLWRNLLTTSRRNARTATSGQSARPTRPSESDPPTRAKESLRPIQSSESDRPTQPPKSDRPSESDCTIEQPLASSVSSYSTSPKSPEPARPSSSPPMKPVPPPRKSVSFQLPQTPPGRFETAKILPRSEALLAVKKTFDDYFTQVSF